MAHHRIDGQPLGLPQCIALIDTEIHLRRFLRKQSDELQKVGAVLFRCEIPRNIRESAHRVWCDWSDMIAALLVRK
jgi:hypothetical protein